MFNCALDFGSRLCHGCFTRVIVATIRSYFVRFAEQGRLTTGVYVGPIYTMYNTCGLLYIV